MSVKKFTTNEILANFFVRIINKEDDAYDDIMEVNDFEEEDGKELFSLETQDHVEEDELLNAGGASFYVSNIEAMTEAFNQRYEARDFDNQVEEDEDNGEGQE